MAMRVVRRAGVLRAALLLVLAAWGGLSLAEVAPLDDPLQTEQLEGWQRALAGPGVALYALAALGYYRIYRRRRAWFVFAVTAAFALLAEAMIAIAVAVNWQASWWEWHLLMLLAFAFVGYSARREWHEERFSAIYLDETLEGAREVSLLFADLRGFTSFAERRPPEAVTEMLNAYFARLIPLLRDEFGAEVHQIVGDEVMAIWNKEGDLPNHAERAARAGLDFQRIAGELARNHPDWPRFRVGVNSGEVVAGVVGAERGHRKHGVVGDTVNLAARLQAEAEEGQVVIGSGTYQRLGDGAVAERLPELHVKGREGLVEAYVLRAL
jgi:class 3 adenylate cyclase